MSLGTDLIEGLHRLEGGLNGDAPRTVQVAQPNGTTVEIDVSTVDRLSSAVRELRVRRGAPVAPDLPDVKAWSEAVCRRITYLLERLRPVEVDAERGEVQVRSEVPDRQPTEVRYYEARLAAPGHFSLRRYRAGREADLREQIDMHLTHELARKLVDDLVATAGT